MVRVVFRWPITTAPMAKYTAKSYEVICIPFPFSYVRFDVASYEYQIIQREYIKTCLYILYELKKKFLPSFHHVLDVFDGFIVYDSNLRLDIATRHIASACD